MSLTNYSDLQTALTNWLRHSLFSAQYGDMVTLFEAAANRRLRTREMEALAILVPTTPTALAVSNVVADGNNVIKVTISSTSTLKTGDEVEVTGVNGTIEANGAWLITVVDGSNITLQGSSFVNTYTSGGNVMAEPGFANLPSDYLSWRRVTWTGTFSTTTGVGNASSAGNRRELRYAEPSYFNAAYPSRPQDVPAFFTVEGSRLKIMPTNGGPLEFQYYQKIPGLVANSTNWLMTAHPDLYLFGSLCEAELFGLNDERMPIWKGRRDELFEEIARQRNLSEASPGAEVMVMGPTP